MDLSDSKVYKPLERVCVKYKMDNSITKGHIQSQTDAEKTIKPR